MRFFDQKIGARITSLILFGLIVSFAGIISLQVSGERQRIVDAFVQGQRNVTSLLAENILPAVRFGRAKVIEKSLGGLIKDSGSLLNHIVVMDAAGAELSSFHRDLVDATFFEKIDVSEWLREQPKILEETSETEIGFLAPVMQGSQPVGAIRVVWDKEPLLNEIKKALMRQLIISVFFIGVVSVALLTLINRSVIRPLSLMTPIMNKMSKGDFTAEIPNTERSDEVGLMAQSVDVFRENGIELLKLRKSLEKEVALKTTEWRLAKEKAEETSKELAKSEERYDLAVKGASVGIWDWDLESGEVYWSDHLKNILHIENDSFSPNTGSFYERLHDGDKAAVDAILREHIKYNRALDCECRIRRDDGSFANIRIRGDAIRNSDGRVLRVAGSVEDISQKKMTEAALREKQKREALGDLASGVAHEINNLLQLPAMVKEIVAPHVDEEQDKVHEYLNRTALSAQKARAIVDDILKFSRGGDLSHSKEAVIFSEAVEEILDFIQSLFPSTVRFEVSGLETASRPVLINQNEFSQVLANLINNAVHAMENKGEVKIALSTRQLDLQEAVANDLVTGEYCVLSLTDQGMGMSPETIERIFNPLFTTKPIGQGTGLGLSVVLGIIHSYHGHVSVESTVGVGSTFTIYLPIHQETEGKI